MDELLLSKIRLGIIAELLSSEWVAFSALARALETTNGNLGSHLGKLTDAGYVEEEKTFVDRRPQSRHLRPDPNSSHRSDTRRCGM